MKKLLSFSVLVLGYLVVANAQENILASNNLQYSPSATLTVTGQVKNYYTEEPVVAANIAFTKDPFWLSAGELQTNADGTYKIKLPVGRYYKYSAASSGYLKLDQEIDATKMEYDTEIKSDIFLIPAKNESLIKLDRIYFDYGTSNVTKESYKEIDKAVKWMNEHPHIKIEVSGHSDNVGSKERNRLRSKERAEVVAAYIVSKGIAKERVTAVGYGDKRPAFPNDSVRGREMNRRVEMKIIED